MVGSENACIRGNDNSSGNERPWKNPTWKPRHDEVAWQVPPVALDSVPLGCGGSSGAGLVKKRARMDPMVTGGEGTFEPGSTSSLQTAQWRLPSISLQRRFTTTGELQRHTTAAEVEARAATKRSHTSPLLAATEKQTPVVLVAARTPIGTVRVVVLVVDMPVRRHRRRRST
jgi:hypothetical protein